MIKLIFVISIWVLYCCCDNLNQETSETILNYGKGIDTVLVNTKKETKNEIKRGIKNPDHTINTLLILNNPNSIVNSIGDITSYIIIDTLPIVNLLSKDSLQCLSLIIHPGSGKNDISNFVVTKVRENNVSLKSIKTNFPYFYTENGIILDMTMDSLISNKGKEYSIIYKKNCKVLVYKSNVEEHYIAKYYFDNSESMIRFEFGYIYP